MESKVLKHDKLTLERIEKFISKIYFTDCNLLSKLVLEKECVKKIWSITCESILTFKEVITKDFEPAEVGESFGPSWRTVWFKVEVDVPRAWKRHEVILVWECQGEATVWRGGQPVQGLSIEAERTRYVLYDHFQDQAPEVTLYIEMSCNALFGVGGGSMVAPPDPERTFKLLRADLVIHEANVKKLLLDFELLWQIAKNVEGQRGKQAMFTANEMINVLVRGSYGQGALARAREMAGDFFGQKNGDSQHTLHAIGHCHIDTAWLWPVRETVRKCCRSFSNVLSLFAKYPDFTFVCSQAQQLAWMKRVYTGLYNRIQESVRQGRFQLVGGVWVEMDANLPSGESLIRQFLKGQQFFRKEFNVTCKEFWLPDTFGYSAQLPQIMKGCGIERFVTQKLSWSFFNKFPHHTFWWHGIDDSCVLVHFPPGDSYSMAVSVPEMLKSVSNNEDQGRTNHSLFLFGFGDGGQGPTEEMLEKIERLKDVDGLPKIRHSNVEKFFEEVSKPQSAFPYQNAIMSGGDSSSSSSIGGGGNSCSIEEGGGGGGGSGGGGRGASSSSSNPMLCAWKGELFLELHNGTYTTQAQMKKSNRRAEVLLHTLECLRSYLLISNPTWWQEEETWVRDKMDALWKDVLLNQFHDILPGSSIAMVYEDAHKLYDDVFKRGEMLMDRLKNSLLDKNNQKTVALNTMAWRRRQVVEVEGDLTFKSGQASVLHPGHSLYLIEVDSMSASNLPSTNFSSPFLPCHLSQEADGCWMMTNGLLSAKVDRAGHVTELYVASSARNAMRQGGNKLVLYDDVPLYWDAWDVMAYHSQTGERQDEVITATRMVEQGELRVALEVELKIGASSRLKQVIVLEACCPYLQFKTQVDWRESHKLLKVEMETSVLSRKATYDIQFGSIERPNHGNTSWDMAQYEVCGHKWADVSEEGYGVAVLSDCKYGWSCHDNRLCLSLLRSPKSPDSEADMAVHDFVYAIMPHKGSWQEAGVVQAAHDLNNPLLVFPFYVFPQPKSFIATSNRAIVISALKPAEEESNSVLLRLYESHGGSCDAEVTFNFTTSCVRRCNMLEELCGDEVALNVSGSSTTLQLSFKPFQIISLLIQLP